MANRQNGNLHDLHIRLKEADYKKIVDICDKLEITIVAYYNRLLHDEGYEKLQLYTKMIKNDSRYIEVSFQDKETHEEVQSLTEATQSVAAQTRKIGTNISTVIHDIRNGKFSAKEALPILEQMNRDIQLQITTCNAINKDIQKLLYLNEGVQKMEIRYKEGY